MCRYQEISINKIVKLLAKETAKRSIYKLSLVDNGERLKELVDNLEKKNLESLGKIIKSKSDNLFTVWGTAYKVDNPLLVVVYEDKECDFKIELEGFLLGLSSYENVLLSFPEDKQRNCYLIIDGQIVDFKIVDNKVILEETECKGVEEVVKTKKKKIAAISKRIDCITEELAVIQRAIKDI